ncbi:MAG: glycosyltransferase family 2 protein [Lewinellaceae bacterium]|nr:glycosyltransferase family 2 protein [Saprospiraceae bacterium]MCB9342028.1 glycosyltransferase family 2 protein [Lewinellaceae bacterium]
MNTENLYIIIPAKDEGKRIGGVLRHLQMLNYHNVVVVNDGSNDNTGDVARSYGATVVNHLVNLGAGAATQTGIEYALSQGAEVIVTLDGDHQHLPDDINTLVNTLHEKKVDVVIGSRFLADNDGIPPSRVFYNKIANVVTYLFTGMLVSDSQSGMKALRAGFAQKAAIRRNGFEFCIEIIRYIKLHNATWCEVPISVVYTKDTMSKGQGLFTGVKMMFRLMKSF